MIHVAVRKDPAFALNTRDGQCHHQHEFGLLDAHDRGHGAHLLYSTICLVHRVGIWFPRASEALQAEAVAFLKTINLAEGFGMGRVIFVTDCLTLQQSIVSTVADRAKLGNLLREAKYQLRLGFIEFKVLFQSRECNVPAHMLARHGGGMALDSERVWLTNLPPDVISAVAGNLAARTS